LIDIKLYNIKDKEELISSLKEMEPLQVAYHGDADGISAVCLLSSIFNVEESRDYPYSPLIFGDYSNGNIALDLGAPINRFDGIIIDHHEHTKIDYKLVLGNVPTGLMIYTLFKDKISDNKKWLAVLSCVGDGQPELIPDEVWEQIPELWHGMGNIYKSKYREIKSYPYPLFAKIATPLNALCRIGDLQSAYSIASKATNLRDIITNPLANKAQLEIQKEMSRIYSGADTPLMIETVGHFGIVQFSSKYSLASFVATELISSDKYRTFIVINKELREISVRGILSKYITNRLKEHGYLAGGHPGYCGVSLLPDQSIEEFINVLRHLASKF